MITRVNTGNRAGRAGRASQSGGSEVNRSPDVDTEVGTVVNSGQDLNGTPKGDPAAESASAFVSLQTVDFEALESILHERLPSYLLPAG
ncbi:MAG: hypothetical protein M1816_004960 [Peltula sp. TS41687]|nr:MAG: hypothetical protein M1816_004960 [Peltula sp. TS41687]